MQKPANPGKHCGVCSVLPNSRTLRKDLPEEPSARGWRNIAISPTRRYSSRWDDPLAEAMRFLLEATVERSGGFTVKKHPIAVKLFLLLSLSMVVTIVFSVRRLYDARAHRAACYRANLEKLNSLEPSTATINTEVQEIQLDQDVIDQLEGTDDDTVIQRRNRMIDGVKLKLTKVNKDRAEGQRRTEQIQAELSSCLAEVK